MVYKYSAGVSGTVVMEAGSRVIGWTAKAGSSAATMTINAGDTITIPANTSIWGTEDVGQAAVTFVFTGTTAYMVEYQDRDD